MENGLPEHGTEGYIDDSVLKFLYNFLLNDMKYLNLSKDEKISCLNDYLKLGDAVTVGLMRKRIKNYDEAVSRGALTFDEFGSYCSRFSEEIPLFLYSMLWEMDNNEIRNGSDEEAREKAREHFRKLNDPEFILETRFSDF